MANGLPSRPKTRQISRAIESSLETSFWRKGHLPVLLAAFLYTEASSSAWILLGPLAVFIAADLKVEVDALALLLALPILVGTFLRLPMGLLVDCFGPYYIGLAAHLGILVALGSLTSLKFTTITAIYPIALLLGLAGVAFAVAIPLVSSWCPLKHQGKSLGLTATGSSGAIITALLAPYLAEVHGWQAVTGLAMLPIGGSLLVFIVVARRSTKELLPRPLTYYLHVLRCGGASWFCFFYAVTFGGMASLASSLVIYFHDRFTLMPTEAGTVSTLCLLVAVLCWPVGGWAADRFGGIRILKASLALAAGMFAIISSVPKEYMPVVITAIAFAMAAFGAGNGATFKLVSVCFRCQMGVAMGLVGMIGGFSGLLFTYSFGLLRTATGSYQTGFVLYTVLAIVALFGLWLVKQRWYASWEAPQATSAQV